MKSSNDKNRNKWYKFFSKWTLVGLILILINIVLLKQFPNNDYIGIFARLLETVGIAMIIGAIFDFSKNSKDFTEFISKILSDIIVSKSFLSKLEANDKKDALSLILQPSNNQLEQYSNINEYFYKQIDKTMLMFNTNFKSNLVLNISVIKEEGLVVSRGTLSYRIYKIQNKYEPITVTFEREGSDVTSKKIIFPGGNKEISLNDTCLVDEISAGMKYKKYVYNIPEDLYRYPYLTIESQIYEPGYDHWTNFHWTSLTPYDGFSFKLNCQDNLVVKEYVVFDEKDPYVVTESNDKKSIRILSTEWLNAYTGFSITIGQE